MLSKGRLTKLPEWVRERVLASCEAVSPLLEAPVGEARDRLIQVEKIDVGEGLLYALLFENPGYLLLSNDKTAMQALRGSGGLADVFEGISGRVCCVEVVLQALLKRLGVEVVARAVTPFVRTTEC
jgi:hypothetical protein